MTIKNKAHNAALQITEPPIKQARNQGGSERADDPPTLPVCWQKVRLVSQVKESIRECNKIKIVSSHSVFSLYCMNKVRKCTLKFSYLIRRKIVKIVANRGQILRQKCTKFDFGWGSAPDPTRGAYSIPPDPLAGF